MNNCKYCNDNRPFVVNGIRYWFADTENGRKLMMGVDFPSSMLTISLPGTHCPFCGKELNNE